MMLLEGEGVLVKVIDDDTESEASSWLVLVSSEM